MLKYNPIFLTLIMNKSKKYNRTQAMLEKFNYLSILRFSRIKTLKMIIKDMIETYNPQIVGCCLILRLTLCLARI